MINLLKKIWQKDAVIVPKNGNTITQPNPLRAGLYDRDVKDIKSGMEKQHESISVLSENIETIISNVIDKETALKESTDAKIDYLNKVMDVDMKLDKLGVAMLTLVNELRKNNFHHATQIHSTNNHESEKNNSNASAVNGKNQSGNSKSSRSKFLKSEKEHPLFSTSQSNNEEGSGSESDDNSFEDLETKIATSVRNEMITMADMLSNVLTSIKHLRADIRETVSVPAGSDAGTASIKNNSVTQNGITSNTDFSNLSLVPELIAGISVLLKNEKLSQYDQSAGITQPVNTENEKSNKSATTNENTRTKSLLIRRANERTDTIQIWKWLEENPLKGRDEKVILLLLIETSAHIPVEDLKALRQECSKQQILYVTSVREIIYTLKNLSANWNGQVSDDYIGSSNKNLPKKENQNSPVHAASGETTDTRLSKLSTTSIEETEKVLSEAAAKKIKIGMDDRANEVEEKTISEINEADIKMPPTADLKQELSPDESSNQKAENTSTDVLDLDKKLTDEHDAPEIISEAINSEIENPEMNSTATEEFTASEVLKENASQSTLETNLSTNPGVEKPVKPEMNQPHAGKPAVDNKLEGDGKPAKSQQDFNPVKLKDTAILEKLEQAGKNKLSKKNTNQSAVDIKADDKRTDSSTPADEGNLGTSWKAHFSTILQETVIPVVNETDETYN